MSYGKMLIHRCDLYRHKSEQRGNFTKEIPDQLLRENIPCRFKQKSATSREDHGRVKTVTLYKLMLPKNIQILPGDIIKWERMPDVNFKVGDSDMPAGMYVTVPLEKEVEN